MENKSQQKHKFMAFLKRNVYYVIIIVCIAAIATILGLTLTKDKNVDPTLIENPSSEDPSGENPSDIPTDIKPTPVIFVNPVEDALLSKAFAMDTIVWNATLRQYEVHSGIDYKAEEGASVKAVYEGEITKISYDILLGNVITIKHSDNLSTTYGSLKDVKVAVGDTVKAGDEIGTVGSTMGRECVDGAHLHFETLLEGVVIDGSQFFADEGDK